MSLKVHKIDEWPYGKIAWVFLEEAADFVGLKPAELRRICLRIGATIINYGYELADPGGNAHDKRHADFVDFGALAASPSWRQLVSSKRAEQGDLFKA